MVRYINYLNCIFMNIDEILKYEVKLIKNIINKRISTQNHHQTTFGCKFYIISDKNLTSPFIQWSYVKIISFAYSFSSSSPFRCNLQVQEHHPHQCASLQLARKLQAWQISHWISTHPYHKGQPLVEFPLTTVSLCKFPLCHLWPS